MPEVRIVKVEDMGGAVFFPEAGGGGILESPGGNRLGGPFAEFFGFSDMGNMHEFDIVDFVELGSANRGKSRTAITISKGDVIVTRMGAVDDTIEVFGAD